MKAIPVIFKRLAPREDLWLSSCEPYLQDGRIYATDGRIALRTTEPCDEIPPIKVPGPKHPPAERLPFDAAHYKLNPTAIPEIQYAGWEKCSCCGGVGSHGRCGDTCGDCGGVGDTERPLDVKLGPGLKLAGAYAKLIREAGAEIYLSNRDKKDYKYPIRIVGPGFEGLVLPLVLNREEIPL